MELMQKYINTHTENKQFYESRRQLIIDIVLTIIDKYESEYTGL